MRYSLLIILQFIQENVSSLRQLLSTGDLIIDGIQPSLFLVSLSSMKELSLSMADSSQNLELKPEKTQKRGKPEEA